MATYEVVMNMDFTKTTYVRADSPEDAKMIAEERERNHQKTLIKSGYSIGDVDVIHVEQSLNPHKEKRAKNVFRAQHAQRERERIYHVGD